MQDDDGEPVKAGDLISFSYGIPPVRVLAKVSGRKGNLWITTFGNHRPRSLDLAALRYHVGPWYKEEN